MGTSENRVEMKNDAPTKKNQVLQVSGQQSCSDAGKIWSPKRIFSARFSNFQRSHYQKILIFIVAVLKRSVFGCCQSNSRALSGNSLRRQRKNSRFDLISADNPTSP